MAVHYTKTNWLNNEQPAINQSNLNKIENALEVAYEELNLRVQSVNGNTPDSAGDIELKVLPEGGESGQVLIKDSSEYGDSSWQDILQVPSGGTENQFLVKQSGSDGDANWQTKEVELTQAEYDALPNSKLTDGISYFIKDGGALPSVTENIPASRVEYDNTSSGLSATNVQVAIDEVAAKDVTAITNAQIDALFV